ncbi:16S rRNA (guanine(527)-N(7))-methyltransferase RsmG [Calothrix sp. 336/3]|uniref:16S rRNA (guanine(527)-N(7))-methyltransferase RsmG n=1 Tax=Calothrix sp. 336/3 TaxID=1337936 RepID=UPI0004E365D2|nr:16S rRNA (guanine(527)-N(7))-methyltransferase RsmG [Calothrix sp. 336/3]AKG22560.1 16S rRNA methyltransferase [Calothrix sp. 336/3]
MVDIWQQTLNWFPSDIQQQQFQTIYELILQANQQFNLTRITKPEEFWEKHLWDSLVGIKDLLINPQINLSIIDIGTGAGFPGIPIAISLINSNVTLVDSTRKKINFLEQLATTLGLNHVTAITARAEEIGQNYQHRQSYDIALIRAVSTAAVCAEYTLPLLKIGGLGIIYRGNWTEDEAKALEIAVNLLGGEIESIAPLNTPLTNSTRHCLYLRKVKETPAIYPRAIGVPTQKPLS